jgi:predicted DNA-binding transcriptional regulator YafY
MIEGRPTISWHSPHEAGIGYVIDRSFDTPPLMLTADELDAVVLGAS